jgi:hypothetical protein
MLGFRKTIIKLEYRSTQLMFFEIKTIPNFTHIETYNINNKSLNLPIL